ncbi:hypothetical protein KCU93_g381, partial [Aureobasidium melanogenum]
MLLLGRYSDFRNALSMDYDQWKLFLSFDIAGYNAEYPSIKSISFFQKHTLSSPLAHYKSFFISRLQYD